MDATDRDLLNLIQRGFPLTSRPYEALGQRLGLAEAEVLERVARLKDAGIIRRIGASFDSGRLGFVSTLCAAQVPEDKLEAFVAQVNRHPGVTHNYLREHVYNVWFTLTAESGEAIAAALEEIARATGVGTILNLPAAQTFKIQVDFHF